MTDKNFKVKSGLTVPSLSTAGVVKTDSSGVITSSATLGLSEGGTGQTTAANALNALLPLQTSKDNYYLQTNGVTPQWNQILAPVYSEDEPSDPAVGQIWVESDSSADAFDPNVISRKSFTATANQTVFTTDVTFTDGYEQVYFNGMLLLRNSDYTTSGASSTVTLTTGAAVNDIVEVISVTNLNAIDAATTGANTFTGNQVIEGSLSVEGIAQSVHNNGAGHAYRIRASSSNDNAAIQFTNNSASTDWSYINALNANKMIIRKSNGANTAPYDAWLNINGGPVHIRDVRADNSEASDWPVPTLSIQSHDDYFENTMFGLFLRDDNPYTLDFSKWVMRLSHANGDTTSSSGTNLKFGGPGALQLFTGNAQRMTIESGGRIRIGSGVTANARMQIASGATNATIPSLGSSDPDGSSLFLGNDDPLYGAIHKSLNNGNFLIQIQRIDGQAVAYNLLLQPNAGNVLIGYTASQGSFRLQVNSQIFATSSSIATSDGRFKENVDTISEGLNIIDSLRPVSFTWKDHPVHNFVEGKTVGFIAQEVQEALSEYDWVDNLIKTNVNEETEEEFLGIAESNIIPLLVAAVKELKARVETLEAK